MCMKGTCPWAHASSLFLSGVPLPCTPAVKFANAPLWTRSTPTCASYMNFALLITVASVLLLHSSKTATSAKMDRMKGPSCLLALTLLLAAQLNQDQWQKA